MINLAWAVYDKQGNLLLGPLPIGSVWEGFAIEDCTDPSGDPVVLYDQLEDRWLLSQFTTRGLTIRIYLITTVWRSHRQVTRLAPIIVTLS